MGFRITSIVWMVCIAVAFAGLYIVKLTVEDLHRDVEVVRNDVVKERESLHLLHAEWAYLNRPERLRQLADAHLRLTPLDSRKVDEIRSLPAAYDPQTGELNPLPMIQPAAGVEVR